MQNFLPTSESYQISVIQPKCGLKSSKKIRQLNDRHIMFLYVEQMNLSFLYVDFKIAN